MPGQFAVRGGIIDVFSPESPQPVRIELLGDTIESIRAFDPNTQRSTNPVERATLLAFDGIFACAEVLERRCAFRSASGARMARCLPAFIPAGNSAKFLREERGPCYSIWPPNPLLIEDEPSLLQRPWKIIALVSQEAFDAAEDPLAEPPETLHF